MAIYIPGLSEIINLATDTLTESRLRKVAIETEAAIVRASGGDSDFARQQVRISKAEQALSENQRQVEQQQEREEAREGFFSFVTDLRKVLPVIVVVVSVSFGLFFLSKIIGALRGK